MANDTCYPPEILAHERFQSRLVSEVPAARACDPAETAALASFLERDPSSFTSGQIISNDGGSS